MSDGILLRGLDGSNPLAFLAALGTLRTLAIALPGEKVKMSWEQHHGAWRPRIWCSLAGDGDAIIRLLLSRLGTVANPLEIDKKLPFAATKFRKGLLQAVQDDDRLSLEWLPAFGTEAIVVDEDFADTDLRMVRSGDSAGQGLMHYACVIAKQTTDDDIRHCLFEQWVYTQRGSSFRWDPNEDAQYALQANNPSKEGISSVIGANRLAIEALPLLPVFAVDGAAITLGFGAARGKAARQFRWPIWSCPVSLPLVSSLLGLESICRSPINWNGLICTGVVAAYSCTQYKPNQYYLNFRPAVPL